MKKYLFIAVILISIAVIVFAITKLALAPQTNEIQAKIPESLADETVGTEPKGFIPVVGSWGIVLDNDKKVLIVDGRKWKEGQAPTDIAQKSLAIFGEHSVNFLDNVKKYPNFPFAVAKHIENFSEGTISLRFKAVGGHIDQAAGILFNLKENGDYLILRANALEANLVLFKFENGKRSAIFGVKNIPTSSQKWMELKLEVSGSNVKGYLDGKLYLEHTLPYTVSGKVGVWSKADSVVYFDDFAVNEPVNFDF